MPFFFAPNHTSHFPLPRLLPDAAALSSMQGLPRSGNSSAQTSASLHPPAALRLRVLPFTRTWSSTVCAEELPTPLGMSLHEVPLLRHSKSFGPPAPIAYATSVSPPDEAIAWPGCRCWVQDEAVASQGAGVGWQMMLLVVPGAVPANHRAHFKNVNYL